MLALVMGLPPGTEAFISGESSGNWIANAFKDFFWWTAQQMIGAATELYNTMADWATELIGDVFHSLSSATAVFQDNANKTITELLNLDEAGHEELPPEWNKRKADPETEMIALRNWISMLKWALIGYAAFAEILILILGFIVARNRRLAKEEWKAEKEERSKEDEEKF